MIGQWPVLQKTAGFIIYLSWDLCRDGIVLDHKISGLPLPQHLNCYAPCITCGLCLEVLLVPSSAFVPGNVDSF